MRDQLDQLVAGDTVFESALEVEREFVGAVERDQGGDGDQAAGRIPDPVVRTEAAFQRAQQAKRAASTALSVGDPQTAAAGLRAARSELSRAAAGAPAPLVAELDDELELLDRLADEVAYGDVTRAAKLSSADAAFKSRMRGRRR